MASTNRVWAFSWRQRCCRALAFPSALLFSFMFCIGQETKLPRLALIKAAAEAGDPIAQEKLGSAYQSRGDHHEAARWYHKAAESGRPGAQYELGRMYLTGRRSIISGGKNVAKNEKLAVPLLFMAAKQGHSNAQIQIGHFYRDGRFVEKDLVEAYKWYQVAANKGESLAFMYRDPLILKLTFEQIAEGERRAGNFRPKQDSSANLLDPSLLANIRLQGIAQANERQFAVVNQRIFEAGEEQELQVDGKPIRLRCVEIGDDWALVQVIVDDGQPIEVRLRRQ